MICSDDSDDDIPPPPPQPRLTDSAGGAVEKSEGGCNPYNVFSFTKKAPRTVDYKRSFSAEYSRHFYVALATEAAQWVAPTTGIVECM